MPQHITPHYDAAALNSKQREIYDIILQELENTHSTTRLYYVDGPGGTGKTTLYNTIVASLSPQGYKVKHYLFSSVSIISSLPFSLTFITFFFCFRLLPVHLLALLQLC